ncbi:MAG: Ku protein [Chloroflexi bacterium]|nr:Ku protein [Chloroflexota bacterium]
MARSMWRGAIQFGLVTIPVKLYLATEARGGLSFNLLHKECLTRIQMKTHCPEHGEITRADTVRGFEWSKGQYVVIEEEDLESVPLKTVRAIEIELFVDAQRDSHGAQFVKQAYYLEPEAIGRKAFYLLKTVLADSGLSAICKVVVKDREQLAALNPYATTMLLSTLHWPDEVRSVEDLDLPQQDFDFKPAERKMAEQLVSAMKGDFSADQYHDDYRQALLAVIEAKIAGQPAEAPRPAQADSKLVDLMSALEASVAAARESRAVRRAPADSSAGEEAELAREPTKVSAARRSRAARAVAPAEEQTPPSTSRRRANSGDAGAPTAASGTTARRTAEGAEETAPPRRAERRRKTA